MQATKNKTMAILIATILVTSMALTLIAQPATGHTPPWSFPSYQFLVPAPNPVGVGQQVAIVMWIDYPLPSAVVGNDIRRHDYTLTITSPSGKVETKYWPVVDDTTSIQYYQYVPTEIGT